jgi:CyaY protein
MTDLEYLDRAEALLASVEASCDRINESTDADIDNQRVGGMVTLTFPDRSQIVVNLQKPLQEVWMAAKSGGFHYRYDGQCWRDTKGHGGEFFADLSRYASEQAGRPLAFSASS